MFTLWTQPLDESSPLWGYCVFSSATRSLFAPASYFWWLVQSFDLFMKVCLCRAIEVVRFSPVLLFSQVALPSVKLPSYINYVYHAVVWTVAGAACILGLVTSSYGPAPTFPICSLRDRYYDWCVDTVCHPALCLQADLPCAVRQVYHIPAIGKRPYSGHAVCASGFIFPVPKFGANAHQRLECPSLYGLRVDTVGRGVSNSLGAPIEGG